MCTAGIHPASLATDQLLRQCDVQRTRRGGPGGQHRNKVETAVRIVHRPTEITSEASERRSQQQNHTVAIFRLRRSLAVKVRRPLTPPCSPSALWRGRVAGGKIKVNPTHDDFPSVLAEALDVLDAHHMEPREAAQDLNCTASGLIRLIKLEPIALARLNERRQAAGLHPLK
jgi:hypothetical protein